MKPRSKASREGNELIQRPAIATQTRLSVASCKIQPQTSLRQLWACYLSLSHIIGLPQAQAICSQEGHVTMNLFLNSPNLTCHMVSAQCLVSKQLDSWSQVRERQQRARLEGAPCMEGFEVVFLSCLPNSGPVSIKHPKQWSRT